MARDKRPEELPTQQFKDLTLEDFIPAASPDLATPWHLGEYLELLKGLHGGGIRVCVSCPPQHGKTTTVLHAIVWLLLRFPKLRIAYASHGQKFSEEQSRITRELFLACGGKIKADHNTIAHWKTEEGGGLIATSWEGSLIGRRVDVMICDDLIKDAEMAENHEQRERIWRWVNSVMTQRLWPGASVVVIGSRWHYDDPSGRLIARGYREMCMPAVREDADGTEHALWPDVKPIAWLDTLRLPSSPDFIGTHDWMAAFQGKPSPRTGSLFGPARYYETLPEGAELVGVGVDIATSDALSSDWSTCVDLYYLAPCFYVHEVVRCRREMVHIEAMLTEHQAQRPPPVRFGSYVSGTEKGIFNLMFHRGVVIERLPARYSKWTRAQKCAIAWRSGRILVRAGQPWTAAYVREVEYFTGAEGKKDDQVDATVSVFDLIDQGQPVEWAGGGFAFGSAVM
jgi:phage terminase large subunit-like protein